MLRRRAGLSFRHHPCRTHWGRIIHLDTLAWLLPHRARQHSVELGRFDAVCWALAEAQSAEGALILIVMIDLDAVVNEVEHFNRTHLDTELTPSRSLTMHGVDPDFYEHAHVLTPRSFQCGPNRGHKFGMMVHDHNPGIPHCPSLSPDGANVSVDDYGSVSETGPG